jgi:hypothetical protein
MVSPLSHFVAVAAKSPLVTPLVNVMVSVVDVEKF